VTNCDQFCHLKEIFRNVWADHADYISVQYAGTGALKTDFTRTGKRTYYGLAQDGWNSLNRYYLNNFADGARADANRYFVGEVSPEEFYRAKQEANQRMRQRPTAANVALLPAVLVGILAFLVLILLWQREFSLGLSTTVLLSFGASYYVMRLIVEHGDSFVDKPLSTPARPPVKGSLAAAGFTGEQ